MKDQTSHRTEGRPPAAPSNKISIGAGVFIGAVVGGMIGGWIAGSAGALVGAILGAIVGGLLGILFSPPRARSVAEDTAFKSEATARALRPDTAHDLVGQAKRDTSMVRNVGGVDSSVSTQAEPDRVQSSETIRIPLAEERIEVDKREIESGVVRLRKVVKTEVVHIPVEVRREEIIVERTAADEQRSTGSTAGGTDDLLVAHRQGDEIVIPLVREEVVVQKEPKVFSEVHVHKVTRTETETIQAEVRRSEVVNETTEKKA